MKDSSEFDLDFEILHTLRLCTCASLTAWQLCKLQLPDINSLNPRKEISASQRRLEREVTNNITSKSFSLLFVR